MSKKERIRVLSLAVVRNRGRILAAAGHDGEKGEDFYRLLGGGVDFGERSTDALIREFQEELGREIRVGRLLGVVENLFAFEGRPGHEVCFIYEAEFVDEELYDWKKIPLIEESFHGRHAEWVDPSEDDPPIYPPFDYADDIMHEKSSRM